VDGLTIATLVGLLVTTVLGPVVTHRLARRRTTADVRKTEVDTLGDVIDRLEAENLRLHRDLARARGDEDHHQEGPP
jgi:hypothetical protein